MQAQSTIYVDTGGNDTFPGTQAQPVRTISEAINRAAQTGSTIDVVSIEAGNYGSVAIPNDEDVDGLSFVARVDPTTNATVVQVNSITNSADNITFGSAGGTATFSTAALDLNVGDNSNSSFTAVESDLLVRAGGTVNRTVGAAFSGNLAFGGTVAVTYTGSGDITAGGELPATLVTGSTLNVNLASGTAANPNTLTLPNPLALSGGDVAVANANAEISGGLIVTDTGVLLSGAGNVGDVAVQAAGAADLTANAGDITNAGTLDINASVTVGAIDNDGVLDFAGVMLTVLGDFDNSTSTVTAGSITFAGTAPVTFSGGPNFDLTNLIVGNGTAEKVVTFTQDVEVLGDFTVRVNATADLQSAFVTLSGGTSTATANGEVVSATGAIIFTANGQMIAGSGQFSNLFVALVGGGDVSVIAGADVDFTGTLTLQNGGLAVAGDISPMMIAGGDEPVVFVNVAGTGTDITGTGTFNADLSPYDLIYDGAGSAVANAEFATEYINDLLVDVSGTVDAAAADEAGTIDGAVSILQGTLVVDAAIIIAGALLVDGDAALISQAQSITLNTDSDVDGGVSGLLVLADGVAVTGASDSAVPSEVENVMVAADAAAAIVGLNQVTGSITFGDPAGATLTLGLNTDDPATAVIEGVVAGDIVLQGNTLVLASDIIANGQVSVGDGTLALGDNDLELSLVGATLSANAAGSITAGTGAVIFGATGQVINVAGDDIANVVLDGSGAVAVNSDLVITEAFTQTTTGDMLAAGANDVTLSGTADIAGGTFFMGTDSLNVSGLTITLATDATINAAVVQGGALTLVGDVDTPADVEETLTVTGTYNQESGELALNEVDLILTVGGLAYDFDGGSVVATTGALVFDGGVAQSYNLASALTVPIVVVDNAAGVTDASPNGNDPDLTIGQLIALVNGQVDTADAADADADADIAIASGATIIRWAGSFETAPEFPGDGSLTVQYGDAGAGFTGTVSTGVELPNVVASLLAYDAVVLNKVVTVSGEFLVADQFDDSETGLPNTDVRVILADLAELILSGNANIVDGDTDEELVFLGLYDLTYLNYLVQATGQELTNDVRTLTINQGAVGAQTIDLSENALVVNLVVADGTFDINEFEFGIAMDMVLAEDNAIVNSDGADAGTTSDDGALIFVGDSTSTVLLAATFNVPDGLDIVIAKSALRTAEGDVVMVAVSGGSIIFDQDGTDDETLVLDQGVLMVPADQFVKLDHENTLAATTTRDQGQGFLFAGASTTLFPRAWIASEVRKDIVSSTTDSFTPGRVVYPLGDSLYAEYTLDFEAFQDQTFGQRTIGVEYFNQQPAGSNFPTTENNLGSADFYWTVISDVSLSSQTQFNVEARNDSYVVAAQNEVDELRLFRRQADDPTNPYQIVGTAYDNFLLDPSPADPISGDEEPVVVAQNAVAGFGAFGTVFTYAVPGAEPPVASVQIQLIHAAPTAPSPVDVYIDGVLVADNLNYKTATPYLGLNVTGTEERVLAIAPGTSTGAGEAIITTTLSVTEGDAFVIIAADDGIDATQDALDLIIEMTAGPSTGNDQVDVLPAHVSPDAPVVDVLVSLTNAFLAQNLAYGEVSAGTTVDAAILPITVQSADGDIEIVSERFDFGPYAGDRGVLIVGGLVDAPATQPTRALDLYFVTPEGEIVQGVEFVDNEEDGAAIPTAFKMNGAYPNPFSSRAQVSFDLPEAANVRLDVYDMLGRKVVSIEEPMSAGSARTIPVEVGTMTSGVYVFQLHVESADATYVESGRLTVVR